MRLPRILRVLAMTRSKGISASYRWIWDLLEFAIGLGLIRTEESQDLK
jgi:hypothetical protein